MDGRPPGEPVAGLLLDRYHIEEQLGEGGLGIVVKAFDTRLTRYVAIKTVKRSLAADADRFHDYVERFRNEAQASARMGIHPNLIAVHDSASDADGILYLILEYIPGGTLERRIKQGPLPLRDALRLTADIARGLQAAHDAGIVHRDVKPSNIFLAADGRAQVGDFGIAQFDNLSRRTHTTRHHPGTSLYMSPEQYQTTGYLRPASDQYSVGLILFEMLTGRAYKVLDDRAQARHMASLPTPVRGLIERLTAERPEERYPSMATVSEVAEALRWALPSYIDPGAEPPAIYLPPRPDPTPPSAPTRPQTRPFEGSLSTDPSRSGPEHGQTPRINLNPVPSPTVLVPTTARYRRRTVLIGIGGLTLAGAAGIIKIFVDPGGGGTSPTTASTSAGTSAPTTAPPATAPSSPPVIATATPSPVITSTPPATGSPASAISTAPARSTSTALPAAATPVPTVNDKLFILNAGTTNENREPQGAQDVVVRFRTNERVYGWVQIAGASVNDRLDVQVYINDAPQQPQVVTLTKTAGIQVFPLNPGLFPPGFHRWSVTYATRGGQNREFTVA